MIDRSNWTPENIAWISGVLEGEGSFDCHDGRLRIQCSMTDEDVIRKMHKLAGFGSVITLPTSNRRRDGTVSSISWRWTGTTNLDVYEFEMKILPHMGIRRKKQILGSHEKRRHYEDTARGRVRRIFPASSS